MSVTDSRRRRRTTRMAAFGTALAAGLLAATTAGAAPVAAPAAPEVPDLPAIVQAKAGSYVVVLAEAPSASYDGSVAGYPATKPSPGKSFDAHAKNVERWESRLADKQLDFAEKFGITVKNQYATALNGFSAELTGEQVAALQKDPAVLMVAPNEQFSLDYSSVDEVGLASGQSYEELAAGWEEFGGVDGAGKGVVVGIIDSGIAPQNPYFEDTEPRPLPKNKKPVVGVPYLTNGGEIAMLKADGTTFIGACEMADNTAIPGSSSSWTGKECNSKVLGARYFADDFLTYVAPEDRSPNETISPYDIDGHGSHTASTSAGNLIESQVVGGIEFGAGAGMAPSAKIAAYKVCWEDNDPETGGCYTTAIVDAIDAAVSDGVDVLNFSISGSNTTVVDLVSVAFFNAAAAGVFVSASAGNSGPGANTVAHGAPWMTTVAAASFSNELTGTVELSDGSKYRGASLIQEDTAVYDTEIVLAEDVALLDDEGEPVADSDLCFAGTLDPSLAAGKIVVCDRGVIARVDKSAEVMRAGGAGMVLVNLSPSSIDADFHSVPSVHVDTTEGSLDLRAAVEADDLTASLVPGDTTGKDPVPQPQIAGFSSRGPHNAAGGDLLKPDVTAPGVGVLAAVSPVGYGGETFGFLSGTSMASPHVAGFGALLLGAHPTWTPDYVKSALMTTATNVYTATGDVDVDNLATGSGYANPVGANRPGLVFANTPTEWAGFVQTQDDRYDFGLPDVAASQVNVASIGLGGFTGSETVTRTVTALEPGTYNVTADVPGIDVTVTPSRFNIGRQQSQTLTLTFSQDDASFGEWTHGDVTITGVARGARPAFTAHVPVSIDVAEAAVSSAYVTGTGASGSATIEVTNGRSDGLETAVEGLTLGQTVTAALEPGNPAVANNDSNRVLYLEMDGTEEFAYFEVDALDDSADFDLYVLYYDFDPETDALLTVTQYDSATGAADESLLFEAAKFGPEDVFAAIGTSYSLGKLGDGTMTLGAWGVGPKADNLTVVPDTITVPVGETEEVSLEWSDLSEGAWLGRVLFGETQTVSTLVKVTVPEATP